MKKFTILLTACLALVTTVHGQNNRVENLQPTGNLLPLVQALESARLYPVFTLPMGAGYYDFELKASVTNWTGGTLVYWTASALDSAPTNPAWDGAPLVWYTVSSGQVAGQFGVPMDGRVWHQKAAGSSIGGPSGTVGTSVSINRIVVIPSKIAGSNTWMYKGNVHLVWSYCRLTTFGKEVDGNGHAIWNPIVPDEWRAVPLNP